MNLEASQQSLDPVHIPGDLIENTLSQTLIKVGNLQGFSHFILGIHSGRGACSGRNRLWHCESDAALSHSLRSWKRGSMGNF